MKKLALGLAALALPVAALAQAEPGGAPSPNEIVDGAPAEEWIAIAAEDMLVMTLAPDAAGNERVVILQLMPAPFSQGWTANIRTLARAEWYDGISVNRVQDNYVVQWGDPGYDNPESGETEQKPLPEGLNVMGEEDYTFFGSDPADPTDDAFVRLEARLMLMRQQTLGAQREASSNGEAPPAMVWEGYGPYSRWSGHSKGWPLASDLNQAWPVHCYGMVGVGRNYSPDTGSGAELYTVIGHAPRHLDRNIALVGRIISGMEHLSSMTRGSGALGFYTEEEAHLRTPIQSIRVASDLNEGERPRFEYLSTEGETFAAYADARANRRDPFFIVPAGGADICNIPVPIRAIGNAEGE